MNKTKSILRLVISIALAFTFSCSSDDSEGDFFDVNSQVYNMDGTPYTGNGIINIKYKKNLINAGNVTNGIAKLELPKTIPDDYLKTPSPSGCATSPKDIKIFEVEYFGLTDNNRAFGLNISYEDEQIREFIMYLYSPKDGKITCNFEEKDYKEILTADVKAGWNKIYLHSYYAEKIWTIEVSTKNILAKKVRWTLEQPVDVDNPEP